MSGRLRPGRRIGPRSGSTVGNAQDERVVDAAQEVHAQASGRRRVGAVGDAVAQVAGDSHGFAGDHDQAVVERVAVHGDPVQPLADLERDDLADVLERRPPAAVLELQPTAAQHERPVVLVLERLVRVHAPQDADVPRGRPRRRARPRGSRARPWWRR